MIQLMSGADPFGLVSPRSELRMFNAGVFVVGGLVLDTMLEANNTTVSKNGLLSFEVPDPVRV